MLFAVMLPSKKNNATALPAESGEAVMGEEKHVCRYIAKEMEEKLSSLKLHFITLHNVPLTLESLMCI